MLYQRSHPFTRCLLDTSPETHRVSSLYWEHLIVNKAVLVCKMLEGALHINQTNIRRLNKLDKLELAHRYWRSIKLSNNPSGKKVTLLASSPLYKHRLFKVILFNNWFILISYDLFFFTVAYCSEKQAVLIIFCC